MPTEQTDTTQTPPEEITYTPTVWADGEDGGTPINAANMNNIEEAIVALVERTTKQVVTSMIADGAVTNLKLSPELQDLLSLLKNIRFDRDKKSVELPLPPSPGKPDNTLAFGAGGIGLWRCNYNGIDGVYEWYINAR